MRSFLGAVSIVFALALPGHVAAQALPSANLQEVLIKTTLLTFNDANITGNYAVLRGRLSKPFRDQFSVEKLKEIFKDFADKELTIDPIAALPPVPAEPAKIDENGILTLTGYFDTKPKQVKYRLRFLPSDGSWKAIGIKVDVE
jgi:hypothetical protein